MFKRKKESPSGEAERFKEENIKKRNETYIKRYDIQHMLCMCPLRDMSYLDPEAKKYFSIAQTLFLNIINALPTVRINPALIEKEEKEQ